MASYTMGSIAIKGGFNKMESKNGSATAKDVEANMFAVSFAF